MLICAGLYKVLMCSHNITIAFILLLNNRKIHYATNLPPLPLPNLKSLGHPLRLTAVQNAENGVVWVVGALKVTIQERIRRPIQF